MRSEGSSIASCPDDEMLAALVEHRISEEYRDRIESHVASCPTCLDVMATFLPAAETSTLEEPPVRPVGIAAPTAARPSRSRGRRWAMAAGLVVAAGGLLFAMQRPIGERIAPRLARWASGALGAQIGAKGIGVRPGSDPSTFVVTLREVAIGHDPGMFASANEIGVTIALSTLFSGEPMIAAVRVSGPQVNLAGLDLTKLLSSRTDRQQVLALLAKASRIDVVDGRVLLPGPGGVSLAVEGLTGGVERTEDGARIVLQGQSAGGMVDVTGSITESDHELTLTIGGRDLDATLLPIVGGHIKGAVDVRLDLATHDKVLRTDGRLAVRNGRLIGRGPGALLTLSPESREALARLDPAFTAGDLRFDDARAVFTWHAGAWRLPRVFVIGHNMIAGGRGRITPAGALDGRGTLRLSPEVVAALQPHEPFLAGLRDANGTATLRFGVAGSVQSPQLTLSLP